MLYKLESLRGVAACLVVIFHSPFMFGVTELSFISNSYLFVDFFFILSGYVMALAYSDKISNGLSLKKYSLLRLGRVYPLHFAILLVWVPYILAKQYVYVSGYGGESQLEDNNLASFISSLFLINSMGLHDYLSWNFPAWSIGAELVAYAVFFIVTLLFDNKKSLLIPLLITLIGYGVLSSLGRHDLDFTYDFGALRCISAFYVGVFIYRFANNDSKWFKNVSVITGIETLSIGLVFVCVSEASQGYYYFIPVILSFAFSIWVFSQQKSGLWGSLLKTPILKRVGLYSYSIYMVHFIVVGVFSNVFSVILKWDIESNLGFKAIIINGIILLLVVSISHFTFHLIEKKYRDKSREWTRNLI